MRDDRDQVRAKAEARFEKAQKAAQDGAEAKTEHEAQAQAVEEKTARLRSLRLAQEAAGKKAQVKTKSAVTRKKRTP